LELARQADVFELSTLKWRRPATYIAARFLHNPSIGLHISLLHTLDCRLLLQQFVLLKFTAQVAQLLLEFVRCHVGAGKSADNVRSQEDN
jgi:hypothetical protein